MPAALVTSGSLSAVWPSYIPFNAEFLLIAILAFALSCNVLQVVGSSLKLIQTGLKLYKSKGQVQEQYRNLGNATHDLRRTNGHLEAFLAEKPKYTSGNAQITDEQDKELRQLCIACNGVARDLLAEIDSFNISEDRPFRDVLKVMWKDTSDLERLEKDLEIYRSQLDTRILQSLRQQVDRNSKEFTEAFKSLDDQGKQIAEDILDLKGFYKQVAENQMDEFTRLLDVKFAEMATVLATFSSRPGSPLPPYTGEPSPSPGKEGQDASTAILEAVEKRDNVSLRNIIRESPHSVNAYDRETGMTALHIACKTGNATAANQLLKEDVKLTRDDNEGRVPLHYAALSGSGSIVRRLLEEGARPRYKDGQGSTPLDYAPSDTEANWVLKYGPRIDQVDSSRSTALHHFSRLGKLDVVQSLLDQGATVDVPDAHKQTALYAAAIQGHVEVMKLLLDNGADIEYHEERNGTPLVVTAWYGKAESVRLLLERGAEPNAQNNVRYTALNEAVAHNHVEVARVLLESHPGIDKEHPNLNGLRPLEDAAQSGRREMVDLLLSHGADVNAKSSGGVTPLHRASQNGRSICVKKLLKAGADPDVRESNRQYTPLHLAAQKGNTEIVRALVTSELGQERKIISSGNVHNWTAIHEAAFHNQVETIGVLLELGADVNSRGDDRSPLRVTVEAPAFEAAVFLIEHGADINQTNVSEDPPLVKCAEMGRPRIIKALLEAGADVELTSKGGYSALTRAAMFGHSNIVEILVEKGKANLNHRNFGGWTAIMEACRWGRDPVLDYLLSKGADPEIPNENGYSPLNTAAMFGHLGCVKLLIEKGQVDIEHANKGGWTSVMEASHHGHVEILEYLLAHGARTDAKSSGGHDALDLSDAKGQRRTRQVLTLHEERRRIGVV